MKGASMEDNNTSAIANIVSQLENKFMVAKGKLEECMTHITKQDVEIDALRKMVTTLEERCKRHQMERDRAVDKEALLRAFFMSINGQFRTFEIEHEPVVRDTHKSEDNYTVIREN